MRRASLIAIAILSACDEHFPDPKATPVPPVVPVDDAGPLADASADAAFDADASPCIPPVSISLEPAFNGATFANPVELQQAAGKFYVVEQGGVVKVVDPPGTALDISASIVSGGEAGLLGMAFDPSFATNRFVYFDYTVPLPVPIDPFVFKTRIGRFTVSADGLTIDPASEKVILEINQPYSNHNGGKIAFGPDGFLYIAMGDGGAGGDPGGRAQNPNELLGKILRIDPNGGDPYAIPSTNPFATSGGAKEIYALGMRNPFRFSFDKVGGTLWAGDVGQDSFEEVDVIELGKNYGWPTKEGTHCYAAATCDSTGLTDPIFDYPRSEGSTVTGGAVYRGTRVPGLVGKYVWADFARGTFWAGTQADKGRDVRTLQILTASGVQVSAFGQDADGELYVVDYSGSISRIAPAPANADAGSDGGGCN